jgi:hypothetical protein
MLPTPKTTNLTYKYKLHFQVMDENPFDIKTLMLTWNIENPCNPLRKIPSN